MLLDQQMPHGARLPRPGQARRAARAEPSGAARHRGLGSRRSSSTICARPPAVHRYPRSMATRIQALAGAVVEHYDGDTSALWATATTGEEVRSRLEALPGFGPAKAAIFTALLGKQLGVRPPGWQQASAPYGEEGSFRSVADVVDHESLARCARPSRRPRPPRGRPLTWPSPHRRSADRERAGRPRFYNGTTRPGTFATWPKIPPSPHDASVGVPPRRCMCTVPSLPRDER